MARGRRRTTLSHRSGLNPTTIVPGGSRRMAGPAVRLCEPCAHSRLVLRQQTPKLARPSDEGSSSARRIRSGAPPHRRRDRGAALGFPKSWVLESARSDAMPCVRQRALRPLRFRRRRAMARGVQATSSRHAARSVEGHDLRAHGAAHRNGRRWHPGDVRAGEGRPRSGLHHGALLARSPDELPERSRTRGGKAFRRGRRRVGSPRVIYPTHPTLERGQECRELSLPTQ